MFDNQIFKNVTDKLNQMTDKEKDDRIKNLKKLAEAEINRRKQNPKKKPK